MLTRFINHPFSFVFALVAIVGWTSSVAWSAEEEATHKTGAATSAAASDHNTHEAEHADDHGDAHGEDDHDAHGGGHGGPYLFKGDLPFWGFVAFLGFCFAIKKLGLWDALLTNMAEREKTENETIARAESHLQAAEQELNAYRGQLQAMDETARESLAEANRDANHTQQEILDLARSEADALGARTRREIERVRAQTLDELFATMANNVAQATEAIVREKLQDEDQERLIDETLNQLAGK